MCGSTFVDNTNMCVEGGRTGMSDITKSDRIWKAALVLVSSREEFRIRDVRERVEEDVSRRTIQRRLRAMTELGILSHKANSPNYRRGEAFG